MTTNVYLTTHTNAPVDIVLRPNGPSDKFDDHFHLIAPQVGAGVTRQQILAIDRGFQFHTPEDLGIVEAELWVAGVFVGALAVMLDSRGNPIKDAIHWCWVVPTTAECRWSDSYAPLNVAYSHPAATVDLTVQGVGTSGFDDIDVTLKATVNAWSSVAAGRDHRGQRVVSFATLTDGSGMVATTPMVDHSPVAAWKVAPVSAGGGRTFTGSAQVLTALDRSAVYLAALTNADELWIGDAGGATLARVGLTPPATPVAAISCSHVWTRLSRDVVDVFLTVGTGRKLHLYHRLLDLGALGFVSSWDDWDPAVAPASYTPALEGRYLFSGSPGGTIRGAGVYYCSAAWGSDSWSRWSGIEALPSGSEASLAALAWYKDDEPQKAEELGLLCATTDDDLYFFTFTIVPPKWAKIESGVHGPIDVAAGANEDPMVARGPTGVVAGFVWAKERKWHVEVVPSSLGYGPVTVVDTTRVHLGLRTALVRQSTTGIGPMVEPIDQSP